MKKKIRRTPKRITALGLASVRLLAASSLVTASSVVAFADDAAADSSTTTTQTVAASSNDSSATTSTTVAYITTVTVTYNLSSWTVTSDECSVTSSAEKVFVLTPNTGYEFSASVKITCEGYTFSTSLGEDKKLTVTATATNEEEEEYTPVESVELTLNNTTWGTSTTGVTVSEADGTITITAADGYALSANTTVALADGLEYELGSPSYNDGAITVTVTATSSGDEDDSDEDDDGETQSQDAPSAPTLKSRTNTTITLDAIDANANGAAAEYSKDGGETWQTSNKFTGLTKGTSYTFVARYQAVDGYDASPASESAKFSTTSTSSSSSSSGSSGSSSSGSSSSSSSSSTSDSSSSSTPTSSNGTVSGWSAITTDISSASSGSAVTVDMNGATTVPATLIAAIAESNAVVTFEVNETYSWTIDGSNISGTISAANLAVNTATVSSAALSIPAIEGSISTRAITLSGVPFGYEPVLTAALGTSASSKFANLYKLDSATGALEFVGVTKADAAGNAIIPVESDGTYVIVADTETKMLGDFDNSMGINALDVSSLLGEITSALTTGEYKADFDGDGKVDAFDAAAILKTIVGLN